MNMTIDPKFENKGDFVVVGLKTRGNNDQGELTAMWDRFGEQSEALREVAVSGAAYGLIDNFDEEEGVFDYLVGVEAASEDDAPEGMEARKVLANNYAVFPTTLETLMTTLDQIFDSWMPHSNYRRAPGPHFEYYDEAFDPHASTSQFYLYIPIEPLAGGE